MPRVEKSWYIVWELNEELDGRRIKERTLDDAVLSYIKKMDKENGNGEIINYKKAVIFIRRVDSDTYYQYSVHSKIDYRVKYQNTKGKINGKKKKNNKRK